MNLVYYTRDDYLKWCKENGVKTILPESKRNKLTISGYPTVASGFEIIDDDIDADEWYKTHGW